MGLVIAEPVPLSSSILWRLNDSYYQDRGVTAWSSGDVPYHSTTSAVLGATFASLVAAFARDCAAGRCGPFDPAEPLYVVELGCGSGRLAWHTLEHLRHLDTGSARVVYVLSDMVESNVAFCADHQRLRSAFAEGRADLALYMAGSRQEIRLVHGSKSLAPGSLANPVIGIASYLFCVIPQDLHVNVGGSLESEHVGVELAVPPDAARPVQGTPEYLRAIRIRPTFPGRTDPHRGTAEDRDRDVAVLSSAATRTVPGERVLYPAAALRSIDRLTEIGGGRMLFLVAERAMVHPAARDAAPAGGLYSPAALLGMGVHGSSLSMPVDLRMVEDAIALSGGTVLRPAAPPSRLELAALLTGLPPGDPPPSFWRQARSSFDGARADDVFATVALAAASAGATPAVTLADIVAILRVAELDPFVFGLLFEALAREMPPGAVTSIERAVESLVAVAARDYPLNPNYDVVYGVAGLLTGVGRWSEALGCLARAAADFGPRAETSYNMAVCHLQLDAIGAAAAALNEALELDPQYEPALRLRPQLPD
jgi:hypothetical protein